LFLKEYWRPRMEEVLNDEKNVVDEEVVKGIREIGVAIE